LLTESADRALAVHLVSFLHSDSPFSLKRISQPEPVDSGRRVATFYGLSDILSPPVENRQRRHRRAFP